MRFLLPGNRADLQISDWDPAVRPIQTRVHARARLQLQHAFTLAQRPDSGEGRVEVTNDSLRASAQNLPQVDRLGKSSAYISSNTRLADQRVLRSFSILDVERGHIPAVDVSLRIEQRVVADQEPTIFAVLPEHTLLIFERHRAQQRLRALFAQPLHIVRVKDAVAIVVLPHIFEGEAGVT